jgi:hypothetical protein
VDITPTLSAVSQDLSVPIEVAGEISNWVIK